MEAKKLDELKSGLESLTRTVKGLDLNKESDKYQLTGVLQYFDIFGEIMAKGKREKDLDVIGCFPLYVEFGKQLSNLMTRHIEELSA